MSASNYIVIEEQRIGHPGDQLVIQALASLDDLRCGVELRTANDHIILSPHAADAVGRLTTQLLDQTVDDRRAGFLTEAVYEDEYVKPRELWRVLVVSHAGERLVAVQGADRALVLPESAGRELGAVLTDFSIACTQYHSLLFRRWKLLSNILGVAAA